MRIHVPLLFTLLVPATTAGSGGDGPLDAWVDAPLDACGSLSRKLNELGADANKTEPPLLAGQPVHDCLQSLPYDGNIGKRFVRELSKYFEFQSTLETLKSPPPTYASDATDILGGLEKMADKAYKSQNDFDLDLHSLVTSAHDEHFLVRSCSLTVFAFRRDHEGLVSVSKDGLALPELYALSDAALLGRGAGAGVSPVAKIDGQDANEALERIANMSTPQDPDARYNDLFRSNYLLTTGEHAPNGSFVNCDLWPGANSTTLTFANGSSVEIPTMAVPTKPEFLNTTSAKDAFEIFCLPPKNKEDEKGGEKKRPPAPSSPEGFPPPLARDPYNEVSGYFLDQDTTVMYIASFGPEDEEGDAFPVTYANTVRDILAKSRDTGRTKLLLDMSGNVGGSFNRLFNTFRILFPDKLPPVALRFRRHTAAETIVHSLKGLNESAALEAASSLAFRVVKTPDQQRKFGSPDEILGSDKTFSRVRLSAAYLPDFDLLSKANNPIAGFGQDAARNGTGGKPSPFTAENIAIMTNGYCHSSCAAFVHMLTSTAPQIRTVAFGGRPRPGPMQAIGGVRGGLVMPFEQIASTASNASKILQDPAVRDAPDNCTARRELPAPQLPLRVQGSVNYESVFASEADETPLQFQRQDADCRLFYTVQNIFDPTTTWAAAKKAVWGGGRCVDGSASNAQKQQAGGCKAG
ncbi:hypothetical protein CDD83_2498 [Cordyceps sp. RAO-2017]|nr:hypothetical protein CDD83_2498 [Cordyceps sp. RAO-2017]